MESRAPVAYEEEMFRLAHISDVHLGPLPDVSYRDLASKRVLGYVNWQRNRRRHMHDAVIDTIVADIKAHYYGSHQTINPTRIVPVGPELDYGAPHDRMRFKKAA